MRSIAEQNVVKQVNRLNKYSQPPNAITRYWTPDMDMHKIISYIAIGFLKDAPSRAKSFTVPKF